MKFKLILFLAILLLNACNSTAQKRSAKSDKAPNVLFIHVDDLGYHDLSFTGSKIYQTPNIDALAKSSLSFTQAYSSYPRCTPSRYGMITATYPVNEDHGYLAGIPDDQNFIKQFTEAGYRTGFIGKWHLGGGDSAPKGFGFDYSYAAGTTGGVSTRFYPYNTEKAKKKGNPDKLIDDVEEDGKKGDYLSDFLTDKTIDFLKDAESDKPFFTILSFYAVHTPLEAKPVDRKRNAKEIAAFDYGDTPAYISEGEGRRKMRQDDPDYAGMVENIDECVGRLLQSLKEMGVEDNTIIVFSSDHGGLSNDGNKRERHLATTNFPLRAGKGHLYEGGIRVPLIVHWKNKIKPSIDTKNIILGMDMMPTLLDLAIDKSLNNVDGQSYESVLYGKEDWSKRTVFWHARKARPHSTGDSKCSVIRSGDYKLLHFFEEDRIELYNLKEDISEGHNLANAKPELAQQLLTQLNDWKKANLIPEKLNRKKRGKHKNKNQKIKK